MKLTMPSSLSRKNRYALKRFAIKLGIILLGALPQSRMPWGFGKALIAVTAFSALIDIFLAIYFRERPMSHTFNHWDEAAAFIAISLVTLALLKI